MERPRKAKRSWTSEQKFQILQDIDADLRSGMKVGEALAKHDLVSSVYAGWKKQLAVGIKSSLRRGKLLVDKEKRRLENENEKLKAIVLSQSQMIADLKKETNWD
jgi:transposase-like protein